MTTELNNRIRTLIKEKNLSPSHFADEIGVQRSSISHILSGRNKPSLEVIQKIVRRFPDLTYEWLLDDSVPQPVYAVNSARLRFHEQTEPGSFLKGEGIKKKDINQNKSFTLSQEDSQSEEQRKGKIVKITLFYDDNTFEEFMPVVMMKIQA